MNLESYLLTLQDKIASSKSGKFFKTGKDGYAKDDIFLGIKVPTLRKIAKENYKSVNFIDIEQIIHSKYHESRALACFLLIYKYQDKNITEKERFDIVNFLMKNIDGINNWDLVDNVIPNTLGKYLLGENIQPIIYLNRFIYSDNLWYRRIVILSCFPFIKSFNFESILFLVNTLKKDKEDLIYKSLGWMLREVGKKDKEVLVNFLKIHKDTLPRITLRYAIERLTKEEKIFFIKPSFHHQKSKTSFSHL